MLLSDVDVLGMEIGTSIEEAKRIIESGRVVAFPTGTSYGLAVDALQGHALQRLRNLKGRPADKTFTVFLKPALWTEFLELAPTEEQLLQATVNQSLTLLVKPRENLAHLAQDGRVGLRVIDHPLMQALAAAVAVPLTATSANKADQPPCYSPAEIIEAFPVPLRPDTPELAPAGPTTYDLSLGYILDGGELPKHSPTTIARLEKDGTFSVIRAGEVSEQQLKSWLA